MSSRPCLPFLGNLLLFHKGFRGCFHHGDQGSEFMGDIVKEPGFQSIQFQDLLVLLPYLVRSVLHFCFQADLVFLKPKGSYLINPGSGQ